MQVLNPADITSRIKNATSEDKALVARAFAFAAKAHEGQRRKSGEPYFIHPYHVGLILADFGADAETVSAGLLHDTVEDTGITIKDITDEFGPTIAFMVDGVTKLGELKYKGVIRHVESLRKLFVAMAADIRVIIIRLADRLHNVRTLQYVEPEKRKRIALETLEIYAPLANRLGMWKMKGLLEDASFPYVYPEEYKQVVALRKTKGRETIKRLEKIYRTLQKTLSLRGLKEVTIDFRIKYLYSLFMKLKRHNMDIESIYDISALRVIVDNIEQCYQVLGIVHGLWRPVPGKLKDYITNPKPNGYQSIHTAIFAGDGSIVEIQIRSQEMQREAEFGAAAHILYDETGKPKKDGKQELAKSVKWIKELIDWQREVKESDEFMHALKTDFIRDRIFVFTPKGDVVELPQGSTILDFAYAIHSDIGDHASGAWMNGKYVTLNTPLLNKCTVKIETKKTSRPSAKWLSFVQTSLAKRRIKAAVTQEEAAKGLAGNFLQKIIGKRSL